MILVDFVLVLLNWRFELLAFLPDGDFPHCFSGSRCFCANVGDKGTESKPHAHAGFSTEKEDHDNFSSDE